MNTYIIIGGLALILMLVVIYQLKDFINLVLKYINKSEDINLKPLEDEIAKLKEYTFFDKYTNVPFTDIRTVTLSAAFSELLKHHQTDTLTNPTFEDLTRKGRIDYIGEMKKMDPNIVSGNPKEIDFSKLVDIEKRYFEYICIIKGDGGAGNLCRCANGLWCNWASEVLARFVFNKDYWDVKKIEIFIQKGEELLPFSKNKKFEYIKTAIGEYGFMSMTNIEELKKLDPGTVMYVVFTMNDSSGGEEYAILKNIVPEDDSTPIPSPNPDSTEKLEGIK